MDGAKSHMTRVIKKRQLAVIIFVVNMILILCMFEMKEREEEITAHVGELDWKDYKDLIVSGIEKLNSVGFLQKIEAREIIKMQDGVDEKCVERIMKQVMVEIRAIVYSSEICGDDTYRDNKPVMNGTSYEYQRGYIEALACKFMERFDSGDIEYPKEISIAKKYVQDLKKFVNEEMPKKGCKQKVAMPSKMFPITEISLYDYILLVLLDIRREILNDYKEISMYLKELDLEDSVEYNLNMFRVMMMAFRFQYFIDEKMHYKCQTCMHRNRRLVIDYLLELPCNHIMCIRCLKEECIYYGQKSCMFCDCMISEFEYDNAMKREDMEDD
ncbi:hypothetical protein CWI40_110050 [Ordospora colligata]|nr:hypothetical protein CWI40_110050 [Ordospora colligata]